MDMDMNNKIWISACFRFGIQGSGLKFEAVHYWANWTAPVTNWVCGYYPIINTVIFDCIPEVNILFFQRKVICKPR